MPNRPRKTPAKPATSPDTLAELLERADRIRQTSDHLIEQMRELASEIAEAKAKAEDRRSGE
jgi:hypothetical protein